MDDSIFYSISNENAKMEAEIATLKRRIEQLEKERDELLKANGILRDKNECLNVLIDDLEERLSWNSSKL